MNGPKDGYYGFSFDGILINKKDIDNDQWITMQVHVDKKPKFTFTNYERSKKENWAYFTGIDIISFTFQLKLLKGHKVQLFVKGGILQCTEFGNCVFNGRFVRPF